MNKQSPLKRISNEKIMPFVKSAYNLGTAIEIKEVLEQCLDAQLEADNAKLPEIQAEERKRIAGKMKRTIIGEERSVPNKTEIWFLLQEEFEVLKSGKEVQ